MQTPSRYACAWHPCEVELELRATSSTTIRPRVREKGIALMQLGRVCEIGLCVVHCLAGTGRYGWRGWVEA